MKFLQRLLLKLDRPQSRNPLKSRARACVAGGEYESPSSPDTLHGYAWLVGGREVKASESGSNQNHVPPRHVIVCGHGRGGTTAICKVLVALGFVTDDANPFLESVSLRLLHKQRDLQRLLEVIKGWDARPERLFWKDPKLKGVESIPLLPQMPASVGFVFIFRDPLSIAIRNDALGGIGLLAALEDAVTGHRRLLQAVTAVKHRKAILVSYEKLVVIPELVIAGLARFLGVDDAVAIHAAIAAIEPNSKEYRQHVTASKKSFTVRRRRPRRKA